MSVASWSAGCWTACPACGGRAFVGVVEVPRRGVAIGCGGCGAVTPLADPGALGLSAGDVRRWLARAPGHSVPSARPACRSKGVAAVVGRGRAA